MDQIEYITSNESLQINDKESNQLMLLRIAFSLNLFQGLTAYRHVIDQDVSTLTYIQFGLAAISLSFLIYLFLKKVGTKELKIDSIQCMRRKERFGVTNFSFLLKNGKSRDLRGVRGKNKTEALYSLCEELGIPTNG